MKKFLFLAILAASTSVYASPTEDCSVLEHHDMVAGQNLDVGHASIVNDGEDLTIRVFTDPGWTMNEVHVYVDKVEPPTNNGGNVVPGLFPFRAENTTAYLLVVSLAQLGVGCGDKLNVVIHASVSDGQRTETAFAEGTPLDGPRWGYLIKYSVCCNPVAAPDAGQSTGEGEGECSDGEGENHGTPDSPDLNLNVPDLTDESPDSVNEVAPEVPVLNVSGGGCYCGNDGGGTALAGGLIIIGLLTLIHQLVFRLSRGN